MRMAAIYARVSSEQQREENTVASQTASLIEFARSHDADIRGPIGEFDFEVIFFTESCRSFEADSRCALSFSVYETASFRQPTALKVICGKGDSGYSQRCDTYRMY